MKTLKIRCEANPRTNAVKELKQSLRMFRSKLLNVKQQWEEPRKQSLKKLADDLKAFKESENNNLKQFIEDFKNHVNPTNTNTDD